MLLHSLDLTTALRPSLLPDETLLFVQDAVGLYQGNVKIAEYQNGQAYLTSHRACYVDNEGPRAKSVAINLKDVERCELYAGFLKSSPKVTLHPKAAKQFGVIQGSNSTRDGQVDGSSRSGTPTSRSVTPKASSPSNPNTTWICPICSFSNPVPSNFDPATANEHTPLAPCLTCGMKPPLMTVVRAAIAGISNRQADGNTTGGAALSQQTPPSPRGSSRRLRCPRCTFENHPSLGTCEMCGATLKAGTPNPQRPTSLDVSRASSPALSTSPSKAADFSNPLESIKFSFRDGGDKIFHDRLKGALIQRKWLLQSAPASSVLDSSSTPLSATPSNRKNIGISGLERHNLDQRKNNEVVIGNAFEDLSALMASAKQIIALAEQFATQTRPSTNPDADPSALLSSLNLTTTREMLGPSSSSTTYLTQLARSLADFLLDDTGGSTLLRASGGIISLVDLWAVYNRAQGGVELVSPKDFSDAVALFKDLRLPVSERKFRGSGLRVVRGAEWSDERIVAALVGWLRGLRVERSEGGGWGHGVTALEAAERFGWSVGVAAEELEMAEERGAVCREVGLEGVRFWENWFGKDLRELGVGLDAA